MRTISFKKKVAATVCFALILILSYAFLRLKKKQAPDDKTIYLKLGNYLAKLANKKLPSNATDAQVIAALKRIDGITYTTRKLEEQYETAMNWSNYRETPSEKDNLEACIDYILQKVDVDDELLDLDEEEGYQPYITVLRRITSISLKNDSTKIDVDWPYQND